MKVGVVCREHPIHMNGGLAIASWNTAKAARDAGIDVLFMTATKPDGFVGCEVIEGIRVLWLANTDHADYKIWHPGLMAGFRTYYEDEKFDLIHCHGYSGSPIAIQGIDVPIIFHDHGSKEGYVQTLLTDQMLRNPGRATLEALHEALLEKLSPESPYVGFPLQLLQFHDYVYYGKPEPAGESDFDHMRRYDMVLATSQISWRDFQTRYMLTNAELFYHCIYDLDPVYHAPSKPPVVAVFAGNLDSPWKCGIHFLSKLLPLKDEIKLKLIGPGPVCEKYAHANFPNCVTTGHLSEKEAMEALWEVDVLYEPSIHHIGLNLTGISAIGLGVPVVAFPTAGHYDLLGPDDNMEPRAGIIVDPTSCDLVICAAIKEVLRDHAKFSEGALKRFDRHFSPHSTSDRLHYLYQKVLRKHE